MTTVGYKGLTTAEYKGLTRVLTIGSARVCLLLTPLPLIGFVSFRLWSYRWFYGKELAQYRGV